MKKRYPDLADAESYRKNLYMVMLVVIYSVDFLTAEDMERMN